MRIAHLSDLHVLSDEPVSPFRYFNKRATGLANLRFRRHAVHKRHVVQALARELRDRRVDHVVVTGDLTNLALEGEFASARRLLEEDLGLSPEQVSVVPGNHDVYTAGSARAKRFATYFADYVKSDIPDLDVEHPSGPFPYVRIRGPVALIGVSSAVPRLPFFAAGSVGGEQLRALRKVFDHPEVRSRVPIVLIHHPPFNPESPLRSFTNGLWDAAKFRELLPTRHTIVLHGHLHHRVHVRDPRAGGALDAIGATSSSLLHEHADRMAGFNWYEVDDLGTIAPPRAFVFEDATGHFHDREIPMRAPALASSTLAGRMTRDRHAGHAQLGVTCAALPHMLNPPSTSMVRPLK